MMHADAAAEYRVGGAEAPPFVEREPTEEEAAKLEGASVGQKPHPSLSVELSGGKVVVEFRRRWGRSPTLR